MNDGPILAGFPGRDTQRVRKLPPSLIGGSCLLLLIIVPALLAPWLSAHDPFTQNLALRLQDLPVDLSGSAIAAPPLL